jgi:hypothetical protein
MDYADGLGVNLAIGAEGAFETLRQVETAMNTTEARIVAEAAKVERAIGGMINVDNATVQLASLGNEMTKTSFRAASEAARIERSGERLVRQLERQNAAYGLTREELRRLKVEEQAADAERVGNFDLANRLLAQEASLYDQEFAAMRKVRMEAEALAEDKAMAAQQAAAAAEREATATREAAFAYQMFEARAREGAAALREFEAAEKAAAADAHAQNLREAAFAHQMFEAAARKGIVAMREQDAAAQRDAATLANLRAALDPAAAAQERLNNQLTEARRVMQAAGASGEELARVELMLSRQHNNVGQATDASRAAMQNLGFQLQDFAVQVVGGTSALRAFAMQAPQAAGALTGFEGKLGTVGRFLNGPWGIALTLASVLAAGFADELLGASKALDQVQFSSNAVGNAQNILGNVMDITTGKITSQSGALMGLAQAQLAVARVQAQQRQAEARAGIEGAGKLGFTDSFYGAFASKKTLQGSWTTQNLMASLLGGATDSKSVLRSLESLQQGGLITAETFAKAAASVANFAVEGENLKVYESAQRVLDGVGTSLDRGIILRAPKATKAAKETEAALKELLKTAEWLSATKAAAQGNVWSMAQDVAKRNSEWGKDMPTLGSQMIQEDEDAAKKLRAQQDLRQEVIGAFIADLDSVSDRVDVVAANMRDAFGSVGGAIGGLITVLDEYGKRQAEIDKQRELGGLSAKKQAGLRRQEADNQIAGMVALTSAAKGLFSEHSKGYKAMEAAEKALTVIQLARTAVDVAGGAARMFATLGPYAFPAVAAMLGVMASLGFGGGGSGGSLPKSNDGTGTVLGDASAKSESIKRAIDSLKEVDTVMLTYSRQMAASLSAIESNISGFAALVLRTDNVNASAGVNTGFSQDTTGKVLEGIITGGGLFSEIPVVGGIIGGIGSIIGSLFGSKTKVVGSGLYGGAQSLEDILSGGFDASYYSDIQKKKKLFGLTTSTKYSTQYSDADSGLENQFTLILREFNNAILAAAGPLGVATSEIQQKLNGFVVNIGKIDLQGLTGEEIEEKLTAVFGAAADDMAKAAFPGIEKFQAVGEGLFDTLVRVASTVESVTSSLTMLGSSASLMSVDLKMALADQFDSVSDFSSAVDSYFETYYTKEEQAAARTAQFATVFDSLGLAMPGTLAAFRQLVDAQDLTTAAGQVTYATLLQLAPAFADLQSALNGAKSAADILSERQDLEKQLLELQGNTAAIREMELANLDESNRALQQQIWALQDAQDAADAAQKLKDAWSSVGDSIMDEVNRIRGITDGTGTGSFAQLQGQFNAAVAAAKAGDQDAAGTLPSLSQALIQAAELAATSRQELDRVKAQTAATLESVYASVLALAGGTSSTGVATGTGAPTGTILEAAATAAQASATSSDSDSVIAELKALREEVAQMHSDNNSGHAANASNTGAIKRKFEDVTADSGGNAITVTGRAA